MTAARAPGTRADPPLVALTALLRGFEAAARRDGDAWLRAAEARPDGHLFAGLHAALLRLTFLAHAEARALLPPPDSSHFSTPDSSHLPAPDSSHFSTPDSSHFSTPDSSHFPPHDSSHFSTHDSSHFPAPDSSHLPARDSSHFPPPDSSHLPATDPSQAAPPAGLLALHYRLAADHAVDPAAMERRFGAWAGLLARFRAVSRAHEPAPGHLFDPDTYPFLEGRLTPADPPTRPPAVSDAAVHAVLRALLGPDGSPLPAGVEQLGHVHEALVGRSVARVPGPAACLRPAGVWVAARECRHMSLESCAQWLRERAGLAREPAARLAAAVRGAPDDDAALAALAAAAVPGSRCVEGGRLVVQPGPGRRSSGSHYTPRALADEVVRTALAPVLHAMGPAPSAARLLRLRICDPAMGAGAFLVAACRIVADELIAAWTREGAHVRLAARHGDLVGHARRLVARRCLYGVDTSPVAVELARLSLWLVTRARDRPFSALDHALRCGDSLVGLDPEQWSDAPPAARPVLADLPPAPPRRPAATAPADVIVDRPLPPARRDVRPFHWPREFPEIWPDAGPGGFDVIVGNPPFLGGRRISGTLGPAYADALAARHRGSKNADLCAYFLRRAEQLLAPRGAIGLITTNTIGQGDTRSTGLQPLLRRGAQIYAATRSAPWPGDASVAMAVVHLARGLEVPGGPRLDGRPCAAIDSRLSARAERPDPAPLAANRDRCFVGSFVLGTGFLLTPAERDELVRRSPANAARIAPYIGGDDINTSPTQAFTRHAIDFADLELADAARWPDLLAIVRERVKPGRDRQKRGALARKWWQYADRRPGLLAALRGCTRCLVNSQVSKHLVFAFQPTDRVFGHTLYVYPLQRFADFAALQSRVHEVWARALSSSLADRLRYTPSDCFFNYPFPASDDDALERIGERLYRRRAEVMLARGHGLTTLYNRLRDPRCDDPDALELRALHRELDRAVLAAHGWSGLDPPAYTAPTTPAARAHSEAFAAELLDRLFALNAARAATFEHLAGNRRLGPGR